MMKKLQKISGVIFGLVVLLLISIADATDKPLPFPPPQKTSESELISIDFRNTDIDDVLDFYSELTDLTIIKDKVVRGKITLKSRTKLTKEEAIMALDSVLAINGFTTVRMGKFLKVIPIKSAGQENIGLAKDVPPGQLKAEDKMVSQIISLKYADLAETQKSIQPLIHPYGQLVAIQRTNALLITETASNMKKILELIAYMDQPLPSPLELRIYALNYALATDLISQINTLFPEVKTTTARRKARRAPLPITIEKKESLITGTIKIVADERTNSLIIVTAPDNYDFLEKIIKGLDVKVAPETEIRIISLDFADAEELAGHLAQLLGDKKGTPGPKAAALVRKEFPEIKAGKQTIEVVGEVKILADKRTNSLIVMTNPRNFTEIERIITELDIMLSQVLIQVIIAEVSLTGDLQYGVEWFEKAHLGKASGHPFTIAGTANLLDEKLIQADKLSSPDVEELKDLAKGFFYWISTAEVDVLIKALMGTTDFNVLSSPTILTADNKEASIMVGEKRPVVTGVSTTASETIRSTYEYKDIGIELKVTPHINENKYVVMEISQKIDDVAGFELIDGNKVPVITTREASASLVTKHQQTIVLGGLIKDDKSVVVSKVPILGDIPLIGLLFRYKQTIKHKTELLIFITPYVVSSDEEIVEITRREKEKVKKLKLDEEINP